ncbi:MAG: hypothetical protein ACOCUL_03115 [Bacteroidota bacterium]
MTQRLSNITYLGDKIDDFDLFENLPDYLKDFYSVTNGFVAFNGDYTFVVAIYLPNGTH